MKKILLYILCLYMNMAIGQMPSLSVKDNAKKQYLDISNLDIEVNVTANIATTTYTIAFYNPFSRDLSGEFKMALSENQVVSRYALEVNGNLREGVVLEKIKARQAFEAVVRQNIDPGLAQKTKGNNFKTTIFPNQQKQVIRTFYLLMTPIIMHLNNFMKKQIILKMLILLTQEH